MAKVENAVNLFKEGYTCSQAILATYGPEFGLSKGVALRLSAPFGAGVARMAGTCGAVNAAFMVLGLRYVKDEQSMEKVYAYVNELVKEFETRNGTVVCKQLLNCDISNSEELKRARTEKLFSTLCPKFVNDAAEILEQFL